MSLSKFDLFGDILRRREPNGVYCLAEMLVLLRAEVGAEIYCEAIVATIMVRRGLGAYLVRGTIQLNGSDHFGGIDKGVNHGRMQ